MRFKPESSEKNFLYANNRKLPKMGLWGLIRAEFDNL